MAKRNAAKTRKGTAASARHLPKSPRRGGAPLRSKSAKTLNRPAGGRLKLHMDWSPPVPAKRLRVRLDLPVQCLMSHRTPHPAGQPAPGVAGKSKPHWILPKSLSRELAATAGRLAALAHPQRLAILGELLTGPVGHARLAAVTGLKPGPLYFHLAELRTAGLIGPKERDRHRLTPSGQRAVLAILVMSRLLKP